MEQQKRSHIIRKDNRFKIARKAAGLTQKEMSERYGIPVRTIQGWEGETRIPPQWAEDLLFADLKRLAASRA